MERFEWIVPVLFGMEAVCAKEIRGMGYTVLRVEDGRVIFEGDLTAAAKVNIGLRTGERLLLKIGSFKATDFQTLFEQCNRLNWGRFLSADCKFPVKGSSLKSQLHSVPDCQKIIKKSIVECLKRVHRTTELPETGTVHQVVFRLFKDEATLMIDTSGAGLHKRGYRVLHNAAPLRETMAAAMVMLSRFSYDGVLADPFCGSGTIPVEAGLIAKNIAPGLFRRFAAEHMPAFGEEMFQNARKEAKENMRTTKLKILASDIDGAAVELTAGNCAKAHVSDLVTVTKQDVKCFANAEAGGTIVCNPPYGERLSDRETCRLIARDMGRVYSRLTDWRLFALTPLADFEACFGKPATKKRKLYNGMIRCDLYQYLPEK